MMVKWLFVFIWIAAAGCSSTSNIGPAPTLPPAPPTNAMAQPTTSVNIALSPAFHSATTPTMPPMVAQAAATPTAMPRGDWKTYTSNTLQIRVDYPPDWSVHEDASGMTFTSPQHSIIQVTQIGNENGTATDSTGPIDLPNTRCTSSTNAHGLSVRMCLDTIALAHTASILVKTSTGPGRVITVFTRVRDGLAVFNAMVESVRPSS